MVIPRSRSRSIESMTRSTSASFARNVPVWRSMASTKVVLPWSTWAMIARLRRSVRTAERWVSVVWGMAEAYPFSRQIAFGVGCRYAPSRSAADGDPHRVPLRIAFGVGRVIGRPRESGRLDIGRSVDIGCAGLAGADAHPRSGRNPDLPRGRSGGQHGRWSAYSLASGHRPARPRSQ